MMTTHLYSSAQFCGRTMSGEGRLLSFGLESSSARPESREGRRAEAAESLEQRTTQNVDVRRNQGSRMLQRNSGELRQLGGGRGREAVAILSDDLGGKERPMKESERQRAQVVLDEYDRTEPYSKERTIAKLQAAGILPPKDLDAAKAGTEPLRAGGGDLYKLMGNIALLGNLIAQHGDKSGSKSERGSFLGRIDSLNSVNKNTASLALRGAVGGENEKLAIRLVKPSAPTPEQTKKFNERTAQFKEQARKSELTLSEEGDAFIIKDITPSILSKVEQILVEVRDPLDVAAAVAAPTTGPAANAPEDQKVRNDARQVIGNLRLSLKDLTPTDHADLQAKINAKCGTTELAIGNPGTTPDQIRTMTTELTALQAELATAVGETAKALTKARTEADTALQAGEKNKTEPLPDAVAKKLDAEMKTLTKAKEGKVVTDIRNATEALAKTNTKIDTLKAKYQAAKKATDMATEEIKKDPESPLAKELQLNVNKLAAETAKDDATPASIDMAIMTLANSKKTVDERKAREVKTKEVKDALGAARDNLYSLKERYTKRAGEMSPELTAKLKKGLESEPKYSAMLIMKDEEMKEARELTAAIGVLAEEVTTEAKAKIAEKNVEVRKTKGAEIFNKKENLQAIVGDDRDIEKRSDTHWTIDVTGGYLQVRFHENRWQTGIGGGSSGNPSTNWMDASFAGDWVNPTGRENGAKQVQLTINALRRIEADHPVDPASVVF